MQRRHTSPASPPSTPSLDRSRLSPGRPTVQAAPPSAAARRARGRSGGRRSRPARPGRRAAGPGGAARRAVHLRRVRAVAGRRRAVGGRGSPRRPGRGPAGDPSRESRRPASRRCGGGTGRAIRRPAPGSSPPPASTTPMTTAAADRERQDRRPRRGPASAARGRGGSAGRVCDRVGGWVGGGSEAVAEQRRGGPAAPIVVRGARVAGRARTVPPSTSSPQVAKRSSGSFCSARVTTSASAGGRSGRTLRMSGTGPARTAASSGPVSAAGNARRPVSSSKRTAPRE